MNDIITFEDFAKVDLRIGTIIKVNDFPEARNPAYQLTIDFGDLGVKKTSAQITTLYKKKIYYTNRLWRLSIFLRNKSLNL